MITASHNEACRAVAAELVKGVYSLEVGITYYHYKTGEPWLVEKTYLGRFGGIGYRLRNLNTGEITERHQTALNDLQTNVCIWQLRP